MQKFNFSYDKDNDDLFLYNPRSKSKGSIELGDIIFDFNSKKELVGLQMMNAHKLISDMVDKPNATMIKQILNNLKETKIDIKTHRNMLIIKFLLIGATEKVTPILSVPTIQHSSPALAVT